MERLKTGALAEPILVGREHEIEELQHTLDLAIKGKGTTIFISGEAGSGKTRLANEFLKQARNNGVTVLSGWCLSNSAVPYFPFMEAFDSYLSESEEGGKPDGSQQLRAKTWLMVPNQAEKMEKTQTLSPQAWKDQTFAAVTKELFFLSTSNPTIIFIDDLHWADSASLALLHYVARLVGSERLLVLATFRSEEVNVNVEEHQHQLAETLRLMGREDLFNEIKLPNLRQDEISKIAECMLGGRVNQGLIDKLAVESQGNPLFIVESIRMLHEQGSLLQKEGLWHLSIEKLSIPAKVKDIILRRIDSLKPNQKRIINAASVIGEKFDPKLLAAVVSQDTLDVFESLNTIAQSTLLICCEGNYYKFNHPKIREMLYYEIPPPLKNEYHFRIATAIERASHDSKELPVSALAYHYLQAGNEEKSVKYALAAGKDALAKFSNTEAINHFAYVLQSIPEDSKPSNEKETAIEGLGEAFFASSLFKEAVKTFEQLGDITTGIVKVRAFRRAMDSAFFQGDFTHLLDLTKKAEQNPAVDRLESARILMNKARATLFLGNRTAGFQGFEAALRIFEEECALPDIARTLLALGGGCDAIGLARALRAVKLYDELGDARGLMDACTRAGQSFGYRMLTEEALDMHAKAIKIGEKIGDFNRMTEATASSAVVFETTGDLPEALSRSLKALEYSEKTDSDWSRAMTYSNLVRQYSKLGDIKRAEEYFEKLSKLPKETLSIFGFVKFIHSKAVFLAAKNRWDEANRYFEESLRLPETRGITSTEIGIRMDYAWALNRQKRLDEAKIHYEAAQEMLKQVKEYFENPMTRATLMVPKEAQLGKEFTMRIDIINVSKEPSVLFGVKGLNHQEFKINTMPNYCYLQDAFITIKEKKLNPFQVETIKVNLQANKQGSFSFEPQIIYMDDLGQTKTFEPKPVTMTVQPSSKPAAENATETVSPKLEFKSENAQKAFEYLINAFMEDYRQRKLPQERSGWRTLMDITKHGKVSKYSLYGFSGNRGQAISELEHLGLVETRIYDGERGRGGKILKARISYEKELVRRQADQQKTAKV